MVGGNLLGKMTARCKLIIGAQNFLRETVMSLILSIILNLWKCSSSNVVIGIGAICTQTIIKRDNGKSNHLNLTCLLS